MEDAVLESKTTELRSRQTGLLSAVEDGNPKSEKVLVFLAGFPDNEISAWGEVLETIRLSPQASTDYRILCLCLPDFEDSAVPKPWGWSITEIAEMLDNTINHYITSPSAQIYFVLHDWGSIFGLDYQNKYPLRVAKMVLFDVGMGMSKGQQPCPKFILVFYQWWWAFAYILSQLFCTCWGKCCFVSFSYLVSSCCQPTPADMAHHSRNARSVKIHMCYIYYQFWKDFFFTREKRLLYEFPTCPVLYMVININKFS